MSQPSQSGHLGHRTSAAGETVAVAVVTVSDTRTAATDTSGHYLREALLAADFVVAGYHLVKDEPDQIRPLLDSLIADPAVDAVILNGGTGLSRRDRTYDVVASLLDRELPGFGELFRYLSFQEIGAAAMLSRATAGSCQGVLLVSLPGSTAAVRLAWEQLLAGELRHLVWELRR